MQPHLPFVVPQGPLAYRRRLRRWGASAGLLIPAGLGLMALLALSGSTSTVRGAAGFLCAVLAAPGVLLAGAPLVAGTSAIAAGIAGSLLLWAGVGLLAARRATQRPAADWQDYWREFLWLACGVWLGVVVALVAVDVVLGRPFV